MKKIVEALRALQAVDNEVRGLVTERDERGARLEQLGGLYARGLSELAEKRSKLADVEAFYRDKNQQLKTDLDKAARSKGKLGAIANQKEYLASQRELEQLRKINSQQEEEILKLLEAIEGYRAGIAEDEQRLASLGQEFEAAKAESAQRLDELAAQIREIESRKAIVSRELPQGMVRKYERTLGARDGLAVVEVIDGTCLGCNIQIPPQRYIELLRMESLMNCPNCQRFIYVVSEEDKAVDASVTELRLANG